MLVIDDHTAVTHGPVSADVLVDAPVTLPVAAYTTTTRHAARQLLHH